MNNSQEVAMAHKLLKGSNFEVKLGELYFSASALNREILVKAFPKHFLPIRTLRLICSMPQLSTSKMQKMEKLK